MSDDRSDYDKLGGHAAVVALVDSFYAHMDTLPEARTIREMHSPDLTESREKLTAFLSGWLGGPPLYFEQYGHPRLRARHLHVAIDTAAAEAWMRCMGEALRELEVPAALGASLVERLARVALHMRNTAD